MTWNGDLDVKKNHTCCCHMVACKHKIVALDMLLHCPTCIIISLTIMLIKTALVLLYYLHFDSAKKSERSLFLNTFVVTCTSSLFCVQCCFSFTLSHLWFSSIHCHLLFIFFNCCLTAISSSSSAFTVVSLSLVSSLFLLHPLPSTLHHALLSALN